MNTGRRTFVCQGLVFTNLYKTSNHSFHLTCYQSTAVIKAEKKLAITLYYLKDTGSFTMIANSFGVATNRVGLIVYLNTAIKHSTVHHFADDINILLINKSLIKTINKNINHDITLFKYI